MNKKLQNAVILLCIVLGTIGYITVDTSFGATLWPQPRTANHRHSKYSNISIAALSERHNCTAQIDAPTRLTDFVWADTIRFIGLEGDTMRQLRRAGYFSDAIASKIKHGIANNATRKLLIDVGAHLGVYAFLGAAQHFEVVAYEAQPDLSCALQMTKHVNRFAHVALHDCYLRGVGQSTADKVEICAADRALGASRLLSEKDSVRAYAGEETYERCFRASVCDLQVPAGAFDFRMAKIDTEGHDYVIMQAQFAVLKDFDVIVSEYFGEKWRPGIYDELCATFQLYRPHFRLFWASRASKPNSEIKECADLKKDTPFQFSIVWLRHGIPTKGF